MVALTLCAVVSFSGGSENRTVSEIGVAHRRFGVVRVVHARLRPFRRDNVPECTGRGIQRPGDPTHVVDVLASRHQVATAGPVGVVRVFAIGVEVGE